MPDLRIQKLLHLQKFDIEYSDLSRSLKSIPLDLAKCKSSKQACLDAISQKEEEIKDFECSRKSLEGQADDQHANASKFASQQLSVKKNEEYTALEHEIEGAKQKAASYEEKAIELMLKIDEAKDSLAEFKFVKEKEIAAFDRRVEVLNKQDADIKAEIEGVKLDLDKARGDVEAADAQVYEFVRKQKKKLPFVVPVIDKKCNGCHLKISGESEGLVRKSNNLTRCDNCGRIIYLG